MEITVNHVNLFYEVVGTGAPLVMIHGNGESHEIFHEAAELLSSRFTCYLLDSRGHGQSQQVPEFHYADMAEDVYRFIQALELKNVTYYGFSDGGIIGLLLASAHPGLLDRMIISGANTRPDAVSKPLALVFRVLNFLHRNPLFELMLREPHISAEQLRSIEAPTLVLAGSRDLVAEEDTRFIAENIPNAALKILPGEGHASYIVHKTKVAELILEFCPQET